MRRLGEFVVAGFDVGALSTGEHDFYARLGWERWAGSTWVATPAGPERTPDDDDGLMLLRTAATSALRLDGILVADHRDGDVW